LQLGAMNREWKEASDCRGAGVFGTRVSKEETLHLWHGHSEIGDIVVVQFERALAFIVFVVAVDLHS